MGRKDTVPSFATLPHPTRFWRLVLFHVRNKPDLLELAQLLSTGVTESKTLSHCLELSLEDVEVRKLDLHREVKELRAQISSGRALASMFQHPEEFENDLG